MVTQEVKPVTRGALELRKQLQDLGRIPKHDARDWLSELDPELDGSSINLVIGYGLSPSRRWWHEDSEGFLVNGPKDAPISSEVVPAETSTELSDDVKKAPLLDPGTMAAPRDQFYTIALNLSIPEKAARTAAHSCWLTADMFNPAEAWQAIVQGSEMIPSQKKRLWRNWCAWAGIKIPEALAEKVEKQYTGLASTGADRTHVAGVAAPAGRRFIAAKGEVMMVEPDDPGGMSFSEALHLADRQEEQQGKKTQAAAPATPAESPTVAAMVTVLGNLTTAALTPRADPAAGNSTLEIVKLMVEGARSESTNGMVLMRQELDHRLENEARDRKASEDRSNAILSKLTEVIERQGQPKNPFEMLDQVLPGIGARLMDNLVNPPHQEGIFRVAFGDQEGNMTVDQYERISKVENQKEFTKMLRLQLPEFFAMGRDFAQAARRPAEPDRTEQLLLRKETEYNGYCSACLHVLRLPEGIDQFTCPHCGALQNSAGELLEAAPVGQEELGTGELPILVEQANDAFDTDALVLRPLDKDREWSPEPAHEKAPPPAGSETATPPVEMVANA